ncbi:MAG: UDP-N-acetylmuramoyl-L-alanyl-D-glutamate--2,6-diaminopimelate ligase [Candidatus Pelagibacter sp. TMED64]|nr:UDP-N-acetylmuramoyl-L-alanyl-D-glutamate--2,6-diaminopimelate ligase [Candidatus Pelagibacter sp.]OUU65881.1 MAG: UDP-N-acetylmuramoyl-L-alanyl-D-glutamate--2,6-diaminopimelate ligase [Candidatus Pelagibacter sp. TMED64]|tara:strand:+ start:1838 stop:4687 length:2850 start_codon:yes stop_codon:yes gene_type:complete
MYLKDILTIKQKKYHKVIFNKICFDTRKLKKGDIFFAIEGKKNSGSKFIKIAISKGASAIVVDKKTKLKSSNKIILKVENVRKSLSEACSKFYRNKPSNIIAVTGTNGKSSVADFFYQILTLNNFRVASIGTLGIISKNYKKKTNLTSIDPLMLHQSLKILSNKKINNVILEASSIGLDQNRLDGLNLKQGIFTNLSHDHLDYHKDMKDYFSSKMYLFKNLLKKNSLVITDEDNQEFKIIKKIIENRKLKKNTIGTESGYIKILDHVFIKNKQVIKISIDLKIYYLEVSLIGYFQIKNLLMAILAAKNCGINYKKIFNKINKIKPVSGRLECVANLKNNSNIVVDFAHTPDALEQSLVSLKKHFNKEIIIVFGCGGERDKHKRVLMGKIAKKYCKQIIITDDNPRNESPLKIRKQIIKSCKDLAINMGNRKKAIETGINLLGQNEVLLVAGKGHEKTQDYGTKIIPFSDQDIIKKFIKKKKFSFKKGNWSVNLAKETFQNDNIKDCKYDGVSIDSKNIKKNNLFFAINGKKNNGHNYVKEALKKGAIKSVVSKNLKEVNKKKLIKVKDTLSALNLLAKNTRKITSAKIIGITGSAGKTTLKNLISFVLKKYAIVYHSPQSYNNKYGVPLSISNLKQTTKYGVFEIGMSNKGEIDDLSKIVKPDIGIITNISEAHINNFKSLKDIAKTKAEIIKNISKGGTVILNKDSKYFKFLCTFAYKNKINIVSFSAKTKADISLLKVKKVKNIYKLKIIVMGKSYYFYSKYIATNFLHNILASISVIYSLKLNLDKINKRFIDFKIPDGRGDIKMIRKFNKKFHLIDESYNANPLSMISAIENMNYISRKKKERKFIFLGDMLELGKKSKKLHNTLLKIINKSDIDKVFVYGYYMKKIFKYLSKEKKGKIFNNLNEAQEYFSKNLLDNDYLMIKGSNATGLNKFSQNIKRSQINVI